MTRMSKLRILTVLHVALLSLFAIYATEEIARYGLKAVHPANDSVKFWNPGAEFSVVAISLPVLLGILACSTGIVKNPSFRSLVLLHGLWLLALTWYGWFSSPRPFIQKELVDVDFSNLVALRRSETLHFIQASAVYFGIVLLSIAPLVMRSWPQRLQVTPSSREKASGPGDRDNTPPS